MHFIYTNGEDRGFIGLCGELDDYLNEIAGGEKKRKEYLPYNTLEDIHDVVLAFENHIPVACAGFKYYADGIAEVKRVFVKEDYRGRGISLLLMKHLEQKAKQQGYRSLILETGEPLIAAMGLYKKIGFKRVENYGPYIGMKQSICMKKEI
jgi:GNAT superfamily N-acetyltransferase